MDEKFIKESVDRYKQIYNKAEHIAELLHVAVGSIDSVDFDEDKVEYVFQYSCCGSVDYDYACLPLRYMWMEDEEILEDFRKLKEEEMEEKKRREEQEKKKREEAQAKAERTVYERLKKKFEGQ